VSESQTLPADESVDCWHPNVFQLLGLNANTAKW
jgi:hypothetical protein